MKLLLTSRIVLYFVLLATVLLAVVGVLSHRSGSESLKAAAISEMLAAAIEKEAALDTWIEERSADIRQLSTFVDLDGKAANLIAAPPGSEEAHSAHAILLEELRPRTTSPRSGFIEMFVMEPESGKVMASTSPAEEGKTKLGHPYFDGGKTKFYLQGPYKSIDLKAPAMTAAIPLRATDGRVVAVLAARLDLAVLNTIAQRRTGLRQTEDSFLFNAGQFPVTQPRFINKPAVLSRKLDTEAIRGCAARNSGVALAPDYRGVPSIAVYRWNAKRQLGLIVKIDQAEALAPARAFGWSVVLISGLALLAILGLAFLLARTITRPLLTLHNGVKRFAEGNFQEPLLESSGDEVGLLAQEFNQMAARVVERTAELAKTNEALLAENAERKRAEESSRASHQIIEGILNAIPMRVFWKDKNLVYLGCNAVFARDVGFADPKDIIGKDDYQIGSGDQAELYRGDDRQVIETGCSKLLIEEPQTTPEGKTITLLTSKLPLRNAKGEVSGVLGTYVDITERKRSKESLRLQSAALEAAANAIVITDQNGTIQFANPAFTALTGYTAQEAVGQNPRILKSGKQDEAFYRNLWQTISSGQVWSGALTNRRKDGSLYTEEMTITPLRNADGVIVRYIAIKQDITERKRSETALIRLAAIVEFSDDAIIGQDLNSLITSWNNGAEKLLGYTASEMVGTSIMRLLPADRQDEENQILGKITRGESAEHFETLRQAKDGRLIEVSVMASPIKDATGKVIGVSKVARDITERKRTETALRESDARYHRLFTGSADGILVADIETKRFKYANPALSRMLGYTEDELRTMDVLDIHPKDAVQSVVAEFEAQARGDKTLATNIPCLRKNGSVVHADINATNITIDNRPCSVGFFRDITERKRVQAELENVHRQLLEASRRGGMAEVATNVLHNVGNVLNSVNISTTLIVQSVKKFRASSLARVVALLQDHAQDLGEFITNDSRGKHLPAHLAQLSEHLLADQAAIVRELDSLRRNVEHIKEIVAMQQNYAKVGGVKELINVADLVEDSLRMNEDALSRHQVEVVREFENVPPLNVEKHKILQILVNLLRNAKLACRDSERADKRLTVRVANGDGRIRISVMDNGVGIPPENLTRIFNHGFTTRKDGHGFGLHSGALAAKEMGGSLTVHSDGPGRGAAFMLELPGPSRDYPHE